MKKIVCLIYLLLFLFAFANAKQELHYDSAQLNVRTFDSTKIASYRTNKDFQYNQDRAVTKSIFERMWEWFWEKYYDLLGKEGGGRLLNILTWIFIVLVMTFFVLKIIGMDTLALFGKVNKKNDEYEVLEENLHQLNFGEAIEQAVTIKNFRLAVRLLYLQCLKKLTDKELINWQPNKTNRQYARELEGGRLGEPFRNITNSFEYAWYGEFPLVKEGYEVLYNEFQTFQQLI